MWTKIRLLFWVAPAILGPLGSLMPQAPPVFPCSLFPCAGIAHEVVTLHEVKRCFMRWSDRQWLLISETGIVLLMLGSLCQLRNEAKQESRKTHRKYLWRHRIGLDPEHLARVAIPRLLLKSPHHTEICFSFQDMMISRLSSKRGREQEEAIGRFTLQQALRR